MSKAVPELRFPGFAGEWEIQRLGKFFEDFRERSTEPDQFDVLTSARSGLVTQREYYGEGRIIDRDNVGFNIIPPNYVTYRSRSDDRKFFFNENKTGKTGIISVYYPVFRLKNGSNKFFIELLTYKQDYIGRFSVGTSQTVLSLNELKRIRLPIPSQREQERVGSFLEAVSRKITLLREKKTALKDYKRGLMQRLFSRELRFTRDDGSAFPDWEERKLGEVAEIVGGGTPESSKSSFWNGDIIWFTPSEIKSKYLKDSVRHISMSGLKSSSAKMLPAGTLVLSTRATVGEVGIATLPCTTNQGFQSLIIKPPHHNEFWYYWVVSNKQEFLRRSAGSTFLEIGKSEVSKIPTLSPHPHEQRRIAATLSALDAKIDALSQKISEVEAFKKGLLQKLFV